MKPKQLAALLKTSGKFQVAPQMGDRGRYEKLEALQEKALVLLSEPDTLKGEIDVGIDLLGVLEDNKVIWQSNKKLAQNLIEQIIGYLDESLDTPSVETIDS